MGCLVAKVAIAKAIYAIDKPYDYLVPKELEETLRPGMRVLVPFGAGNRGSDGMVLALRESDCGAGLKAITAALDQEPVLDGDGLRLALWMRERYFCTVYDSVKAILPAGLYYALKDCVSLSPDLDDAALEAACQGSAAAKQLLELLRPYQLQILLRHKAALSGHGVDKARGLQFIVGPFCGDDGYFQVLGQPPDGGQRLSRRQRPGENLPPELRGDLLVNGLAVGIADNELHGIPPFVLYIYSIYG